MLCTLRDAPFRRCSDGQLRNLRFYGWKQPSPDCAYRHGTWQAFGSLRGHNRLEHDAQVLTGLRLSPMNHEMTPAVTIRESRTLTPQAKVGLMGRQDPRTSRCLDRCFRLG